MDVVEQDEQPWQSRAEMFIIIYLFIFYCRRDPIGLGTRETKDDCGEMELKLKAQQRRKSLGLTKVEPTAHESNVSVWCCAGHRARGVK